MKGRCFLWFKHKIKYHGRFGYRCSRCLKTKKECSNLMKMLNKEREKVMIKLSELKDDVILMDENQNIYEAKEVKNDTSIDGKLYTTMEYQAGIDARRMLENAIENECDNMYEDWEECILDDVTDGDIEKLQAVLDDIFNRAQEQNIAYYQDEEVDMEGR